MWSVTSTRSSQGHLGRSKYSFRPSSSDSLWSSVPVRPTPSWSQRRGYLQWTHPYLQMAMRQSPESHGPNPLKLVSMPLDCPAPTKYRLAPSQLPSVLCFVSGQLSTILTLSDEPPPSSISMSSIPASSRLLSPLMYTMNVHCAFHHGCEHPYCHLHRVHFRWQWPLNHTLFPAPVPSAK